MVILNIPMVLQIPSGRKEAPQLLFRRPVPVPISTCTCTLTPSSKGTRSKKPLFGRDERVEEPGGVEEVGLDGGAWGAEEIEEDEVFDGAEFGDGGAEAAFGVGGYV